MIALLDCDEIAYMVAFSYQKKKYYVSKGDIKLYNSFSREEAIESIGNSQDLELESTLEVKHFKDVDIKINKIISSILINSNCYNYKAFLSGENNFRKDLATLQPYKGNRYTEKPVFLQEVKDYFKSNLKAEVVDYLEADDLLSHYSSILDDTVICSSDKDLKTVPGLNYNIRLRKFSRITEKEARYNFYTQLLVGDTVDNIPSPYLLGKVGAEKHMDKIDAGSTDKELYDWIKELYIPKVTAVDKEGNYKTKWYSGQDIDEVLYEIGNLLYMHRTLDVNERWEIPI
jgi:hypothetical protein